MHNVENNGAKQALSVYTYLMDEELRTHIEQLEQKMEQTYAAAEKTRKYIWYMLIGTLITLVLPLIGLAIVIPIVLSTMNNLYSGLI